MGNPTYKDSGVDLDIYRDSMARLPRWMHRTFSPRVLNRDGGFAGLFRLDFPSQLFARDYVDPVLVSCTDGVGTKLKVAILAGVHNTVGIDLVAMSVNDAICCGAEPLFFLDYVAMSRDDPARLEQIVAGISDGCLQADCALLGGETAIMPDLYGPGDYDLAGFCVGVAERNHLIDGASISAGDKILGIASSGLHSNGFSLARKVVFEMAGLTVDDRVDELGMTVGQALLEPTRIYARLMRTVLDHYKVKKVVHGVAHVTGGGLQENLERIVPNGLAVTIDHQAWPVPAVFTWLQKLGDIDAPEMDRVFNMGIGLVLVVSSYFASHVREMITDSGTPCWEIGQVEKSHGRELE
jgi:phosphoribosylformylglycinamidine cyclo-ligase